jgi:hypothetical protein
MLLWSRRPNAVYDDSLVDAGVTPLQWRVWTASGWLLITPCPSTFTIGNKAFSMNKWLGSYYNGPEADSGIDTFSFTCRHESKHLADFQQGIGHLDKDGDYIADYLEDINGNGQYDPEIDGSSLTNFNTFGSVLNVRDAITDDSEWRAYNYELSLKVQIGKYDQSDWSCGNPPLVEGRQWDH